MPEQAKNNTNKNEQKGEGCLESVGSVVLDIAMVALGLAILAGLGSLLDAPVIKWLGEYTPAVALITGFLFVILVMVLLVVCYRPARTIVRWLRRRINSGN